MKAIYKRTASLLAGVIMAALILSLSAFAAGSDVQASYKNGTVTVSAQGLAADTVYHLISVQKNDSVVALKSGSTDGSGAMTDSDPHRNSGKRDLSDLHLQK